MSIFGVSMQANEYKAKLNGAFSSLAFGVLSTIIFFAVAELFSCSKSTQEKLFWLTVAIAGIGSISFHIYRFFKLFGEAESDPPKPQSTEVNS